MTSQSSRYALSLSGSSYKIQPIDHISHLLLNVRSASGLSSSGALYPLVPVPFSVGRFAFDVASEVSPKSANFHFEYLHEYNTKTSVKDGRENYHLQV